MSEDTTELAPPIKEADLQLISNALVGVGEWASVCFLGYQLGSVFQDQIGLGSWSPLAGAIALSVSSKTAFGVGNYIVGTPKQTQVWLSAGVGLLAAGVGASLYFSKKRAV